MCVCVCVCVSVNACMMHVDVCTTAVHVFRQNRGLTRPPNWLTQSGGLSPGSSCELLDFQLQIRGEPDRRLKLTVIL